VQVLRTIGDDRALRQSYEKIFGPLPSFDSLPAQARPSTGPADALGQAWSALTVTEQTAVNHVFANVGKAIAAYERTLVTGEAPFDRFARALAAGDRDGEETISVQAKKGLRLFIGKAQCILCHSGPLFTDLEFHNLGLPDRPWLQNTHPARRSGAVEVLANPFNGDGAYSDAPNSPATRKLTYLDINDEQIGQYKTPSLRNVAQTAPYMHGGHFATLTDVVGFYSMLTESPSMPVGHRDEVLLPLFLDEAEIAQLVAFLETLSGALPMDALARAGGSR
jgi:cytochrome c peroxidase